MKIGIGSLLTLAAVWLCSAAGLAQQSYYYTLIDSAESHIMNQEWPEAEEFLLKALRAEPDNNNNSLLLSNLATVQRYQGNYAEALKNYSVALYMTPRAVTLLKNRASLYIDMDSVDRAYEDYERVIELDNMDLEALYNHAMLAIEKGKMGQSEDDIYRIEAISPKSYYAINGRATWNRVKGNMSAAVDGYTKVIKARPTVDAYVSRAECYIQMKKLKEAEEDLRVAIDMRPDDGYLYALRARVDKLRYDSMALTRDIELAQKHGLSRDEINAIVER